MSLTRKLLESLGIESDKVTTIIEAHAETVDALKAQIGDLKSNADKYETTKADLDKVKAELDTLKGSDWQKKYEKEHADFEAFKTETNAKESKNAKETAYRELLSNAGVSEKRIASIMKVTNLDSIEIADGKIKDADKLTESIKTEWADFIVTSGTKGANTPKPPKNDNGSRFTYEDISKMSREEINKNWDSIKASLDGKGDK